MTKNDMIKVGVVVGIVAGVVLFGLQYLVQRGREINQQRVYERAQSQEDKLQAARTQLSQLDLALAAFEIDVGRYPTTAEGLLALVKKPASQGDGWNGAYIKKIPKDPWGQDYIYQNDGNTSTLRSSGADHKSGTSDDVTNE